MSLSVIVIAIIIVEGALSLIFMFERRKGTLFFFQKELILNKEYKILLKNDFELFLIKQPHNKETKILDIDENWFHYQIITDEGKYIYKIFTRKLYFNTGKPNLPS